MTGLMALTIFATVTTGIYLLLSRDLFRCVIGLVVLGAATSLILYTAGRLASSLPAVIAKGEQVLGEVANPLPQALVLTAIVIGFALICFALVLLLRVIRAAHTDDALQLRHAEPVVDDPVKPPISAKDCDPLWPPSDDRQ